MNKYRVTITRKVVESVTFNVEGRTEREALFAVGPLAGSVQEAEWSRAVGEPRVGKVERVTAPAATGDLLDVPDDLKRSA